VRISLDYYRILGVTNRATAEQIAQAHSDRLLSMPRKEYSEAAIASRRRLLDSANAVLSDPIKRKTYDYQILAKPTKSLDQPPNKILGKSSEALQSELSQTPNRIAAMEVDDREINGVLLILQELGDYSQILSLSRAFLQMNEISPRLDWTKHDPDILLSNAIAHAETGREDRRQGRYEVAAQSLEISSNMLLQAGTFLTLRSEIQADLLKLCPYRILELLASAESTQSDRQRGINLLKQMLDARSGIDGKGDDYSGLNSGDFVQFIQRLRPHMTVAEQQRLFEDESKRPSTIAAYLAVYSLIGGGFSQRKPEMIRSAKGQLVSLSSSQDVYIEQAICALLLGQTEEAGRALERSGEQAEIELIRQASEGAPDLLPGLCPYSERWIQEYVYPYFSDLLNQTASLTHYFADSEVQDYIDSLPQIGLALEISSQWKEASNLPPLDNKRSDRQTREAGQDGRGIKARDPGQREPGQRESERFQSDSPSYIPTSSNSPTSSASSVRGRRLQPEVPKFSPAPKASNPNPPTPAPVPEPKLTRPSHRQPKLNFGRLILVVAIVFALISGFSALAVWAWRSLAETSIALESPLITPIVTPIAIVKIEPPKVSATGEIDQDQANKLVAEWQNVKAKALGSTHELALLESVLAEPVLSTWRSRAENLKSSDSYIEYVMKSLESKKYKAEGKDKAIVRVRISETRNLYEKGSISQSGSKPDSNYEVSYTVVRKEDKLLIQDMLVHD
jgi:curved DNA-binding protein CbpA